MSKQLKILIFSLICLLICSIAFFTLNFFLPKDDDKNYSGVNSVGISSKKQEKIIPEVYKDLSFIRVKNESGEFTIRIEREKNNSDFYHITKLNGEKLSDELLEQSIIKNFIEEVLELVPVRIVDESAEELSNYGLSQGAEKAMVELNFDENKVKRLILGNEAPLSVGYYLKDNDFENKVYLITEPAAEKFFSSAEDYIISSKAA